MAKVICTELQKDGASGPNITLDTSKNVTCENNLQVDGNVTVTGTLPADKLTGALPAISGANLTGVTGTLSNRNILYNGAMQISQRAASTGVGASNGAIFATDRWSVYTQNTGSRYTISQDGESPDGFGYSLKIDCTTADTSLASNEEVYIQQKIEGFDVQRMQKGTSGAKAYTLSFWAKSVKTGTYICRLLGRDNTTSNVSKAYTISDTNWNKYTINFPADTDSSRKDDNNNGEALRVMWYLVAGSGINTGTLQETWAGSSDSGAATGQVNFADSTSNIFYLTGVQLEPGSTATEYEHRSYGDELHRCQRYYQVLASGSAKYIGLCMHYSSTIGTMAMQWPTRMRAAPTLDFKSGSGIGDLYLMYRDGTSDTFQDWAGVSAGHDSGGAPYVSAGLSGTAGHCGAFYTNSGQAHVALQAEL